MAALDKLGRALHLLKLMQMKSDDKPRINKKREKLSLCMTVTDLIRTVNIKNSGNFRILMEAIPILLELLEESDTNGRLIIDESINRIIRAAGDNHNHLLKIVSILLSVMKNNNNPRTLKAAIWRFSELARYIKPQKAKVHVQYLVPILVKISEMKDEMLLETLGNSLSNILDSIGLYTTDNDIKFLLRAFLRNLYSDSAAIRRSGVYSIIAICQHSRKPYVFFSHFIRVILDALLRIQKDHIVEDGPLLGLFTCIRQIIPYISENQEEKVMDDIMLSTSTVQVENYLQIYELCLHYSMARDQNISAVALETLHQLLQSASSKLIARLTKKGGLSKSTTGRINIYGSALSLAAFCEDSVPEETELMSGRSNLSLFRSGSVSQLSTCTIRSDCNEEDLENWNFDDSSEFIDPPSTSASLQNIPILNIPDSGDEYSISEGVEKMDVKSRTLSVDNIHEFRGSSRKSNLSKRKDGVSQSQQIFPSFSCDSSFEFLPVELEIGNMVDPSIIPLDYCARHLVSSFLLECHTSFKVRVSVISLALNCLSQVFRIYPNAAFLTVEKNVADYNGIGNITEVVILYCNHEDQQVRGLANIVFGHFLKSASIASDFNIRRWLPLTVQKDFLERLVSLLIKGIEDDLSVCVRHALTAISTCLNSLFENADADVAIRLYRVLFKLKENSYWLIKVRLVEIMCTIPYRLLYFIDGNTKEQEKIIDKIFIPFLKQPDNRIRQATAESLVKLVPNLYYPTGRSSASVDTFISYISQVNNDLTFVRNPCIYQKLAVQSSSDLSSYTVLNATLSRIIYLLHRTLMETFCKYFIAGCSEALRLLSIEYPPNVYSTAWQCFHPLNQTGESCCGLFDTIISYLLCSPVMLELDTHANFLQVASKLYGAMCMSILEGSEIPFNPVAEKTPWHFISNKKVGILSEILLQHLIRVMNVFANLIENVPLASTPSILSAALKSPTSALDRSVSWRSFDALAAKGKSLELKLNEGKSSPFGYCANIPLYGKLRDSFESSYNNYKVTLNSKSEDKFLYILKIILDCLSGMLEFTTFSETDRLSEELLNYLQTFVQFAPTHSIHCAKQLLKSIFSTNTLCSYLEKKSESVETRRSNINNNPSGIGCTFYSGCFEYPQKQISMFRKEVTGYKNKSWDAHEKDTYQTFGKYLNRTTQVNLLQPYIKLFEPIVGRSLKCYTMTRDTYLQSEILLLLTEFVELKVNFTIFDPDQAFITFVQSQIQYIEEDQVRNVEILIPKLFNFLVQLSNDKHSKPIMFVPKIMQLCDCLIASEHIAPNCIAALSAIIEQVFLSRPAYAPNSAEFKELETQRDVLFSMLLRFIHHAESLKLLQMIIVKSDNENIQIKRSSQIVDLFFDALAKAKIEPISEITFLSILNLILAFHQDSYTNEQLLNVAMSISINKNEHPVKLMMNILPCLLVLLSKSNEDQLLEYVERMCTHCFIIHEFGDGHTPDPLNVCLPSPVYVDPSLAFNRLLLLMVYSATNYISSKEIFDQNEGNYVGFMKKMLSCLLSTLSYNYTIDAFPKLRGNMINTYYESQQENNLIRKIHYDFQKLSTTNPILTLRWNSFVMTLNEHDDTNSESKYENRIQSFETITDNDENYCFKNSILKHGVFLLNCFHIGKCKNFDNVRMFFEKNLETIITNIDEQPVQELLNDIQNLPDVSRVYVRVISEKLQNLLTKDVFLVYQLLQTLEYVNSELSGQILLLCSESSVMFNVFLPVSKLATTLAIRNSEYLLTLQNYNETAEYLKSNDLQLLILRLSQFENSSRNLLSLLNKLAVQCYQLQDLELLISDGGIAKLQQSARFTDIDEVWFFNQVKHSCCSNKCSSPIVCAQLLSHLALQDLFTIMRSESFNNCILPHCFIVGLQLILQKRKTNVEKTDPELPELYLAARSSLIHHVQHLKTVLPINHEVYMPVGRMATVPEQHYLNRMNELFNDSEFMNSFFKIIPAVIEYIKSINQLTLLTNIDSKFIISDDTVACFTYFAVLCSEVVHWSILRQPNYWSNSCVLLMLECCLNILSLDGISKMVTVSQIGCVVSCLFRLVQEICNESLSCSNNFVTNVLKEKTKNSNVLNIANSSDQIGILIDYITGNHSFSNHTCSPLKLIIRKLTAVLSGYKLIYNYVRIPKELWKHIPPSDVIIDDNLITVNSSCEELLQDSDILKQFINRGMFIGWKTRQQFEESWVSLLTVLSSTSASDAPAEEILSLAQCSSIAVNAITSLLIQTLLNPIPGNTTNSSMLCISRNKDLNVFAAENLWNSKLNCINEDLENRIISREKSLKSLHSNLNVNIERLHNRNRYDYNQISVEFLSKIDQWKLLTDSERDDDEIRGLERLYLERERALKNIGIDLESCIHFLLDFYTQWFSKQNNQPLCLTLEVVKSMIIISDLFTEKMQFSWLMNTLMLLHQKHPIEDDILHQYITLGICKAAAVATPPDAEMKDNVLKCLITGLSSNYYPMQISSLHGLLYLLESVFKKNELNTIEVVSAEFEEQILMIAVNYAAGNLDDELPERCSEQAALCIISISFYLLENEACSASEDQIFDNLCSLTTRVCKLQLYALHMALMQGFYNLILLKIKIVPKKQKLLLSLINESFAFPECTTQVAVANLQLLLALMFVLEFEENPNSSIDDNIDNTFDTDKLIAMMENVSIFFDRIKIGFRLETEIICGFLPTVLQDFFDPSKVLNKTINEFLSPQQPYPDLMCDVVFKVFQHAIAQSQQVLLQEWVMQLLNNFIQGYSFPIATFFLTCFFISASTNKWLISLFPRLKTRLGLLEHEDIKLLCIAAKQFHYELDEPLQNVFISSFKSAVKMQPKSPFTSILAMFQ